MTGLRNEGLRARAMRVILAPSLVVAMVMTVLVMVAVGVAPETAQARGPEYSGPQTGFATPAYFGPAPNPFPYCESPTYFDPFPENVNSIGSMDIGDTASVTTDGVTMTLELTSEGNPGTLYPGFFDTGNDQAKGIELAEGDGATITLSAPLFYSQWIFTDVDQPSEGFTVTPTWTVPGEAAVFGGDNNFTFAGTTNQAVQLDETLEDGGVLSQTIEGRVQVDFLGAVTGIQLLRTFPSEGQSGFAVGGGCEAAGAAKTVVAGPTWNGTGWDVTYELRMGNNLPSAATIQAVIDDAVAGPGASLPGGGTTGPIQGIDLTDLQLTDDLSDAAFSSIVVTGKSATGNLVLLDSYDGLASTELIQSGTIAAESQEAITLDVEYTPDLALPVWETDCAAGYVYLNQSEVTGSAANVTFADMSDDGESPAPGDDNGAGGVDDPTEVIFPCPPGDLQIVKTAVAGAGATCPAFVDGVVGDGDPVQLTRGDIVTYCITVRNGGPGDITDVEVVDAQAPQTYTVASLEADASETFSYELEVNLSTPERNTATATGTDSSGSIGPVADDALISVADRLQPNVQIVKTVVPAGTDCPTFEMGVTGLGPALQVDDTSTVTYCISILNIGEGPATNVAISDPQSPDTFAVIDVLGPTERANVQYDVVVSTATPTVNVASVAYLNADNEPQSASDDAQIEVVPLEPSLEIVKTVLAGADADCPVFENGEPGLGDALPVDDRDTVTYCITVRNVGPGIATDVAVTDSQAPGDFDAGTLDVDDFATFSYNVTVDLTTELVNTAGATGNGPSGPLAEVTDQAQIVVSALPDPRLEIVKTAIVGPGGMCPDFDGGIVGLGNPVRFLEGETVTYCITVRNTGQGAATDVTITDPQAPDTLDLFIGDLGVDEFATRSYDVTLDASSPRSITNVAEARGNGPNGPAQPVDDAALVEVTQQPDPRLEIVKTAVAGGSENCPTTFTAGVAGPGDAVPFLYGDVVTYCINVRNVGDNPATNVVVTDDQAAGPLQFGTIDTGEERAAFYDVTVDADTPSENIATVNGDGPNGSLNPVSDPALISPSPQPDPQLEIVKTAVQGPTGECPSFTDGTAGAGDPVIFAYGSVVTYCITVRNVAGTTATGVVITDPQAPEPFQIGELPVGESRTRSYDVVVSAETPAENVATVTGNGPNGATDPVRDPAVITPTPLPDPELNIVKTAIAGPNGTCPTTIAGGVDGQGPALMTGIGNVVTYCLAIQNTGVGAATDVQIDDDQATQSPFVIGTLASGETRFAQYDVLIMRDTNLVNTAVVTGNGPNGQVRDDDDSLLELDESVANISLVHSVSTADEECITESQALNSLVANREGLEITWCAEITNTGNVPLTNVTLVAPDLGVTDPVDALEGTGRTVLLPGQSVVLGFDGEIPDGGLFSTGTAAGDPSDENGTIIDLPRPTDVDTAEARESSINLETTVVDGADGDCAEAADDALVWVGNDITWCFEVTNTGATALWVEEVVDVTLGIMVPIPENQRQLLPGQSIVVSVNDIAEEGGMVNDAEVLGLPLDDDGSVLDQAPAVQDEDPARVNTPVANLSIDKSANAPVVTQGESVSYTLTVTNEGPNAARDVVVRDSLPTGLRYTSVPALDGWACALDSDERGFSCSKATPMENGETAELTYVASTASAPPGTPYENVAEVESPTPDPDPTDNVDDETIETEPPVGREREPDPPLEYPGPFTQPEPPEDEVLGLAITGAASDLLSLLAALMLTLGGVLSVGSRRRRREQELSD